MSQELNKLAILKLNKLAIFFNLVAAFGYILYLYNSSIQENDVFHSVVVTSIFILLFSLYIPLYLFALEKFNNIDKTKLERTYNFSYFLILFITHIIVFEVYI